ncbi:MAG: hypothetical protein DWH98_06910 [Planctomycetota bacterium]|nr:MAG: hypothetical protein DWH98_06910 [Planctomycetota bacterium]RLT02800.1 MAG: hypothetical protein DWI23_06745 [Planctomycetota bacterium]
MDRTKHFMLSAVGPQLPVDATICQHQATDSPNQRWPERPLLSSPLRPSQAVDGFLMGRSSQARQRSFLRW